VNNNCATGSTALHTARKFVMAGEECVLALGFEKMDSNLKDTLFPDREAPAQRHFDALVAPGTGIADTRIMPPELVSATTESVLKVYARAAEMHMQRHGTTQVLCCTCAVCSAGG
jgi:acetyl-CoA acetyltransferase